MLGLYEFKYLVGENEIDYHLSAKNTYIVSIVFLKHIIWMRFNFNKSIVVLKAKTYF